MRRSACLLTLAAVLPLAEGARAHGAEWTLRVIGARVGSHEVTVRTAPRQPRVGRLHVEVQLIDPRTLRYIEQTTVRASATRAGGTRNDVGPELARLRAPWHELDLELPKSGSWEVRIRVDGPDARGEVSFRIDLQPEDDK